MKLLQSFIASFKNMIFFMTHRLHHITVYNTFTYGVGSSKVFYRNLDLMTRHEKEISRVDTYELWYRDQREVIQEYQECFSTAWAAIVQGDIKGIFIHPEDCDWALGAFGDRPKLKKCVQCNMADLANKKV